MSKEQSLSDLFEQRKPALELVGRWVTRRITTELQSQSKFKFELEIPIQPRIKETKSFIDKALRRGKKYTDPLNQIHDQVGIRLVFLLQDQVDKAYELIHEIGDFKVSPGDGRDLYHEMNADPETFRYKSMHLVVYPVCEMPFDGKQLDPSIPCEIQIRTLLQHTYARLSHTCIYKSSLSMTQKKACRLKRVLAQGAALTEVADEVFSEIQKEINEYSEHALSLVEIARKNLSRHLKRELPQNTLTTLLCLDSVRIELDKITEKEFKKWLGKYKNQLETLKTNPDLSPLATEPIFLIFGYLAHQELCDLRERNIFLSQEDIDIILIFFGA